MCDLLRLKVPRQYVTQNRRDDGDSSSGAQQQFNLARGNFAAADDDALSTADI
jgi:hypothetical protein